MAISPDGTLVAAGGGFYNPRAEGWLKVWDAASGKLVWDRPVPGTTVMSLAFHPDGRSLAVGYGLRRDLKHAGHVQLHRVTDGAPLGDPFGKLVGGVNAVAFDRDGRRLALAGFGRIEVWDVETRAMVEPPLTGHTKWVYCVAFHPDGKHLASGGWDNTIQLWDLDHRRRDPDDPGPPGLRRGDRLQPGRHAARLGQRGQERPALGGTATGRQLAAFHGHTDRVHALAFHPDGRRILSGSLDGTVKVWDAVTSRPVIFRGHSDLVRSVEFLDDGTMSSRGIRITVPCPPPRRRSGMSTPGRRSGPRRPERTTVPAGSPTPRPRVAASAASAPTARSSPRSNTGRASRSRCDAPPAGGRPSRCKGHTSQVSDVVFSPDGTRIATASFDGTVKLWDAATGQEVLTLAGAHRGGPLCRVQPRRDEARLGGP